MRALLYCLAFGLTTSACAFPALQLKASAIAARREGVRALRSDAGWELAGYLGLELVPREVSFIEPETRRPHGIELSAPCRQPILCRWELEQRLSALIDLEVLP